MTDEELIEFARLSIDRTSREYTGNHLSAYLLAFGRALQEHYALICDDAARRIREGEKKCG